MSTIVQLSVSAPELDSEIDEILDGSGIPGAAVVVVTDSGSEIKTCGVRAAGRPEPVTSRTSFDLGSCSKSFVATAIALLCERGELGFDVPVRRYLPEFHLDQAWMDEEVTIRDLLCNRIGLKRQIPIESFANPEIDALQIVSRIRKLDRLHPFREGYVYFNPGFMAARLIVERVSGMQYGRFLQENLFGPLAMQDSASGADFVGGLPETACGHVVEQGHLAGESRAIPLDLDAYDNWQGAAGIYSSAQDMTRWLGFLLNNGVSEQGKKLLSPALLAELHSPHTRIPAAECKLIHTPQDGEPTDYCLGWWTTAFHGHRLVQHAGEMMGWRAHVALVPEQRLGVAVMLSASVARHAVIAYTVLEHYLGVKASDWSAVAREGEDRQARDMEKSLEKAFPNDKSEGMPLDEYAGDYSHPALGTVRVSMKGSGLLMTLDDGRIWDSQLERMSGHVFSSQLINASVRDYMPLPLRARFDVEDGRIISLSDANATYLREATADC
jgi:CubicO group peptidase (beta-lactamase class C family)